MISISSLSAATGIKELKTVKQEITNSIQITAERSNDNTNNSLANQYRGSCLDGITFSTRNRDEAQGFVNGYCRGRK